MRINKFLAENGVASRRKCDELISQGEVKVNGKTCTLGQEIDEFNDSVTVNGKKVQKINKFVYYMLNKPKGYVTTVSDDKDRKTVMELLPKDVGRIYPVGRLDYDSEGLLLFTNDGDLTNRLTHPSSEIPKTYQVKIEGKITESQIGRLHAGVEIDGVMTKKCTVKLLEETDKISKLSVTVTEGRNRQVRKMFEAIGKEVIFLKRVSIGNLTLRGLDRGNCRKLTPVEVDYLKNL